MKSSTPRLIRLKLGLLPLAAPPRILSAPAAPHARGSLTTGTDGLAGRPLSLPYSYRSLHFSRSSSVQPTSSHHSAAQAQSQTQSSASTSTSTSPPTSSDPNSHIGAIPSLPPSLQGNPPPPLKRYNQLVSSNILRDDPHQRRIIGELEGLHEELVGYSPPPIPSSSKASGSGSGGGLFGWLGGSSSATGKAYKPIPPANTPKGKYLYGTVGTGKTMLMDLFYSTLPPHLHPTRKRIHFHAFMLDVFKRVHAIKEGLPSGVEAEEQVGEEEAKREFKKQVGRAKEVTKLRIREKRASSLDPMAGRSDERAFGVEALHGGGITLPQPINSFLSLLGISNPTIPAKRAGMDEEDAIYEAAREMAEEGRVLCFDEFQVTDIVTAMILRQLLERLMGYGVVCIMTSNRHPDDLYKNGIQRASFEPCIDLIKERFDVVDLNSETDYRKIPRALSKVYFHPLSPTTRSEMQKLFHAQTSLDPSDPPLPNRALTIWGRKLLIPESTSSVARFSFQELCGRPLSSADYLKITGRFGVIFLEEVGKMSLDQKDMARRFITFIDACYENHTRLFISSEVPIFEVFSDKDANVADEASAHMRSIMDDLGLPAESVKASSMFTAEDEIFSFARCVSRLTQMGTKEWAISSEPAPESA